MPFVERKDVFFNTGPLSFAEPVTLRLAAGDRVVQAIFDDPFFDTQVGEVVLDTRKTMLTLRDEDAVGLVRGTIVVAKGRNFSAIEVRPDGTGVTMVELAFEP